MAERSGGEGPVAGRECRGAVAASAVVGVDARAPVDDLTVLDGTARRSARHHILRARGADRLAFCTDADTGPAPGTAFGEGFMNHPVRVEVDLVIVVVAAVGAQAHERARRGEL